MNQPPRLRVNEIFCSIQGEGSRAGMRCAFVRLTGCLVRCRWCDTAYAFDEGSWLTLDEILARLRSFGCPLVEVTGGEPLLQPNVYPLLRRLADEYPTVLLETSGTLSIARVDPRVARIVDFKCPSSGAAERNCWENVALLTPRDEVKFVIADRADYEWARDMVRRHDLSARGVVLFSPVSAPPGAEGGYRPVAKLARELAEWLLEDRLDVRLGLQLHKIVWPERTRGV